MKTHAHETNNVKTASNRLRLQAQIFSSSEVPVNIDRCFLVSRSGLFGTLEVTEGCGTAIYSDGSPPSRGLSFSGNEKNAFVACGASGGFIGTVLAMGCGPQIADAVVRSNAINVVQLVWPSAVHVKPRQSMSIESLRPDKYASIAQAAKCAGHLPHVSTGPADKHAGFRAIVQQCSQFVSGDDFSRGHLPSDPHKKQNEDRGDDGETSDADKKKTDYDRCYVNQRLRELAIWERRISGK